MPIEGDTYLSFAKLAIDSGHTSYSPQWSKTAECDRLVNWMYDEALVHASDIAQPQRLSAFAAYAVAKRGMAQGWYRYADAETRNLLRDFTLNNALVQSNEGQIGRCGRFHRALTAVYNEAVGHNDKKAVYQIWLNNLILGIAEELGNTDPPVVADITLYRIDGGTSIVNTGASIDLSEGQRLDLYTTGIGFASSQWQLDSGDLGGEIEEALRIDSVVLLDTGAYVNQFTNANGTTPSNPFNVSVT